MAITAEREVARADMNDAFGVTVWQEATEMEYTPEDARKLAAEIVSAADEAERVAAEDAEAAKERMTEWLKGGVPIEAAASGEVVL